MKVSIITPTKDFNIQEKTLDSILAQTDKDFEWIIVFDCNTDGQGLEILFQQKFMNLSDKNKFIKTIYLNRNYGPGTARNIAFQVSDGDIITYLDNGDELFPSRVGNIIEIFSKYPETNLYFAAYNIISPEGREAIFSPYHWFSKEGKDLDLYDTLQKQNISIPMGVAHKRKPFVECGGFQRGIVCGEDGILWRRMSEKISTDTIMFSTAQAGTYYISKTGQSRTQRRFDEGGFAFNASEEHGSHGQYLDYNWFNTYNSAELFDK